MGGLLCVMPARGHEKDTWSSETTRKIHPRRGVHGVGLQIQSPHRQSAVESRLSNDDIAVGITANARS